MLSLGRTIKSATKKIVTIRRTHRHQGTHGDNLPTRKKSIYFFLTKLNFIEVRNVKKSLADALTGVTL